MDQDMMERAIGNLAEAFETGNPLAPLPVQMAPASQDDAEELAGGVLARLGFALAACALRRQPMAA